MPVSKINLVTPIVSLAKAHHLLINGNAGEARPILENLAKSPSCPNAVLNCLAKLFSDERLCSIARVEQIIAEPTRKLIQLFGLSEANKPEQKGILNWPQVAIPRRLKSFLNIGRLFTSSGKFYRS
jgi:hypothetical protein